MPDNDSVTVVIYCTGCGNRSVRSDVTGELRDARIRMPRAMIDEVRKACASIAADRSTPESLTSRPSRNDRCDASPVPRSRMG